MLKRVTNIGNNNNKFLASVPKRYRMIKIEKLGNEALKQVMDMIKKDYSYAKIAKTLTEIYEIDIKPEDVSKVLKDNAKLMVNYRVHLEKYNLTRANLVLDETVKFADAVDSLEKASNIIEERLATAITNDDVVKLGKALTDNLRSVTGMIRNYKRLTGQSQEKPSILIDQSTKQVNIATSNDSSTNKLVKELGMANFNVKKYVEPEVTDGRTLRHQKEEKVVDAEVVEEEDGDTD